ncbi:potassium voltage-gated channel subfamily C member 1-like [Physella acuta]|uniref:potassium voltage-gated channel subfamily C member 1-like n=1 Tax=Physella acuta TaxID=109671 RepID=UPI0027DAFEA8|nr:potassium voltage-gated channel subfamily C member 1-like [Physella acuta]
MPKVSHSPRSKHGGILHALLPGARLDKNTNKIRVHTSTSNEIVKFNVGGHMFETYRATLRAIPKSPLANNEFLARHFRTESNDYFFDRDPEIFHCVLNHFRTGELHLPTSVCGPVVKSELEFWGLDEADIEECCWSRYSTWATTLQALRKLEDDRNANLQLGEYPYKEHSSFCREIRRKAWKFFSTPSSSVYAQVYGFISLSVIFLSIISFCANTHPDVRTTTTHNTVRPATTQPSVSADQPWRAVSNWTESPYPGDVTPSHTGLYRGVVHGTNHTAPHRLQGLVELNVTSQEPEEINGLFTHPSLHYLDIACLIFLTLELVARFLVSPHKAKFVLMPMSVIEFLALLPDLTDNMVQLFTSSAVQYGLVMRYVNFLKVLRVFRIFRLMRHIPGLWILFYTLKASIKDLLLLLLFVFVGMLIFSSLIFFAESDVQPEFSSIPKCFWWAVITMTTVGYGDMYPKTSVGYLIGTATGIAGVLMIGFTVPVLVNNFVMYYNHTTSSIRREQQRENRSGSFYRRKPQISGLGDKLMSFGNFRSLKITDINPKNEAPAKGEGGTGDFSPDETQTFSFRPKLQTQETTTTELDDDEVDSKETVILNVAA